MALNAVTLAEKLRPWRTAGITHFLPLAPEEYGAEPCHQEDSAPVVEVAPSVPPTHSAPVVEQPVTNAIVSPQATQPRAQSSSSPASSQGQASPHLADSASPSPLPASPAGNVPPVEAWPQPWREVFAKAAPAPLLWTYGELALDLAGKGDKARSGFLRTLIGTLSLPKGSSVFWPSAVLDDTGQPAADPAIFFAGLNLLAPKVVILLGPSAITHAGLPLSLNTPYTQQIFQGRLYILLPEFSVLLHGNSADQACAYLRSAFSQFSTLFHALQG